MLLLHRPELIFDIGTNYYEVAEAMDMTAFGAAKYMVHQAARAGATAVKFQWYKAERLTRKDAPAYWDTKETQFEVFKRQDLFGLEEYTKLKEYCHHQNIEFMATAFDEKSLTELDPLVKRHKIASCEITNYPFLSLFSKCVKPIILSVGAATGSEIMDALEILGRGAWKDTTLMHCVLEYPTPSHRAGLQRIADYGDGIGLGFAMRKCHRYGDNGYTKVGYSDHCIFDKEILLTAWLLGATVIEKHFTVDIEHKGRPQGNDHEHAMDVRQAHDFWDMVFRIQDAFDRLGTQDRARKLARRGVYLTRNIRKGRRMRWDDVECLRPQGDGITPIKFDMLIKKKSKYQQSMKKGDQIHG